MERLRLPLQRERLYDIFEALCGARFTNSYTRVGGLMYDMTALVIEKTRSFVKNFPKTLYDMERLLNRNRIFIDRTKGVGVLSKEEALNRSASGPMSMISTCGCLLSCELNNSLRGLSKLVIRVESV